MPWSGTIRGQVLTYNLKPLRCGDDSAIVNRNRERYLPCNGPWIGTPGDCARPSEPPEMVRSFGSRRGPIRLPFFAWALMDSHFHLLLRKRVPG